jgi:hypothetical protein
MTPRAKRCLNLGDTQNASPNLLSKLVIFLFIFNMFYVEKFSILNHFSTLMNFFSHNYFVLNLLPMLHKYHMES